MEEGNIRIAEVLCRLREIEYDGPLILEHVKVQDFASSRRVLMEILKDLD